MHLDNDAGEIVEPARKHAKSDTFSAYMTMARFTLFFSFLDVDSVQQINCASTIEILPPHTGIP